MTTREWIEKVAAILPKPLQGEVDDFARVLRSVL